MNDNVTQVEARTLYFETIDGQHVLPASLTKRTIARFIDLISYGLLGSIFLILFYGGVKTDPPTFTINFYDWMFVVGVSLTIISTVFFAFIYPLFINKKNIGQSLGKQIFNIAPMYLNKKYNPKLDIVKREIPLSIFYILINIVVLLTGINFVSTTNLYNDFLQNLSENPEFISNWEFVKNSKDLIGANGFQQAMGYIYIILSPVFFTTVMIFLLSIAFGKKKRGIHDIYSKTAIVDLSTMGYIESYKPVESEITPSDDVNEVESISDTSLSKLVITSFDFEETNEKELDNESNNQETSEITIIDNKEEEEENKI